MYESVNTGQSLPTIIEIEPGLNLQKLTLDKADILYETIVENYDHLSKWLPWPKFTKSVDDSKTFIKQKVHEWEQGTTYAYSIENDGQLVGLIDLRGLHDASKTPEIGYWISSAVTGKGITTKATTALTHLGVNDLHLSKIIIRAHTENIGSNKVAEKSGYKCIGQYTDDEGTHNIWEFSA